MHKKHMFQGWGSRSAWGGEHYSTAAVIIFIIIIFFNT